MTAWGDNGFGQTAVPSGLEDVRQVAAGGFHTLALTGVGRVTAWGDDTEGQIRIPESLWPVSSIAAGGGNDLWRGGRSAAIVTFIDCNGDGQRDTFEIAHGWMADENGNDRLDACEFALGDLDLSGEVDTADLALLLLDFGPCPGCLDDLDGDGQVDNSDLALLLLNFGPTG